MRSKVTNLSCILLYGYDVGAWWKVVERFVALPQGRFQQISWNCLAFFSQLVLFLVVAPGTPLKANQVDAPFQWYGSDPLLPGTFVVQDKVRGLLWLLNFKHNKVTKVQLPFNGGNHESALTADGRYLATGHYETLPPGGKSLSGIPGDEVSLVDLKSASAQVYPTVASPKPASKSHGVLWLSDGRLAVTAELANSIVIYPAPGRPGSAEVFELAETGCRTPHMLRQFPGSTLLFVTCRATNPGDSTSTQGYLVGIDLLRKSVRSYASGLGAEGFVLTPQSEVWVGNIRENTVSIFGFTNGKVDVDSLVLKKKLSVAMPMRLAYEPDTNRVGVITSGAVAGSTNLSTFDAASHQLMGRANLASQQRGWIDPQGLAAIPGVYITGGINNQALLLIDARSLAVKGEVLLPRCPLSSVTSNGSCQPTMRNPNDTTAAMLDGFAWTPVVSLPDQHQ